MVSGYHKAMHKRLLASLLGLLAATQAAHADEWWAVHRPSGHGPAFLSKMPDAMPVTVVRPAGAYDPRHPFDKPVARVDGVPVQRPLLPSMVADPVDRALILRDYRKNGFMLQPFQLSDAAKRQQRLQFHDVDALRDLRLQKEHAALEDYRRYVAEEIKLATMLHLNCQGAISWAEQDELRKNYLTRLRRKAVVETLPS